MACTKREENKKKKIKPKNNYHHKTNQALGIAGKIPAQVLLSLPFGRKCWLGATLGVRSKRTFCKKKKNNKKKVKLLYLIAY